MEMNTLSLIVDFLTLISSITIALILYRASRKIENQNFSNALKDSWITIDSTILSNDKLLIEADFLIHPESSNDSIEVKRRRWICYMVGNTLSVNYNGIVNKLMPDSRGSMVSLERTLKGMTRHPEFMQVVDYFYEDGFKKLVRKVERRA